MYRSLLKDDRTPLAAKIFLWIAVSYLLLPFDLIPDFIPIFGQLDDLVIVPLLIYFALKLIPYDLIAEYKTKFSYIN